MSDEPMEDQHQSDAQQHQRASWPPQHVVHELQRVRGALGFASPDELRHRIAATFCTGVYAEPPWLSRRRILVDGAAQTDGVAARRDVGVMDGATSSDALPVRDVQLDGSAALRLPRPGDFPVLTAAQLAEAETRVSVLLRRIEQELDTVAQEEATSRRQASSLDAYGSASFKSAKDWNDNMKKLVTTRLDVKFQQAQDPSIRDWHRARQQEAASPVRHGHRGGDEEPHRGNRRYGGTGPLAMAAAPSSGTAPPSPLGATQRYNPTVTTAAASTSDAKRRRSLDKAMAAPLFPDALAFFGGYQKQLREQQEQLSVEFAAQRQQLQQQQGRSIATAAQILSGLGGSQTQYPPQHGAGGTQSSPALVGSKPPTQQQPPSSLGGSFSMAPTTRRTPTPT